MIITNNKYFSYLLPIVISIVLFVGIFFIFNVNDAFALEYDASTNKCYEDQIQSTCTESYIYECGSIPQYCTSSFVYQCGGFALYCETPEGMQQCGFNPIYCTGLNTYECGSIPQYCEGQREGCFQSVKTEVSCPTLSCSSAGPDGVVKSLGSNHTVYAYGVKNASSVYFPTWSDAGGQDDLVWYPGSNQGSGTWSATIPTSKHGTGTINTHVYMNGNGYTDKWCGTANFTVFPAPTISLSVSQASIKLGQSISVSWSSENTDTCAYFVNGGTATDVSTSGFESLTPAQTATYSLTCDGPGGTVTKSMEVTVDTSLTDLSEETKKVSYTTNGWCWTINSDDINDATCTGLGDGTHTFRVPIKEGDNIYRFWSDDVYQSDKFWQIMGPTSINITGVTKGDYTLSVLLTGEGTVTGTGIDCGSDCSETYDDGTSVTVTLSASASSGYTFKEWSETGCSGTSCNLTMDEDKSITATFTENPTKENPTKENPTKENPTKENPTTDTYKLDVSVTGSGTVTGTGIDCGSDCSETYDDGTSVSLSASPSGSYTFTGWSGGGCSGTGSCNLTMSSYKSVTATFTSDSSSNDPNPGLGSSSAKKAPILTSPAEIFAADDEREVRLTFVDVAPGMDSVIATITGQDSLSSVVICRDSSEDNYPTPPTYSFSYDKLSDDKTKKTWITPLTCDFSTAQKYDLSFTACDTDGACTNPSTDKEGLYENFFTVVAGVPAVSASVEVSKKVKVADGEDTHFAIITLKDEFGNPVVSKSGIKDVSVKFNFDNTTKLDQIAGTGDSARYLMNEFGVDQNEGTVDDWFTEADGGNGEFEMNLMSFAPTSAGFDPISDKGIDLTLDSVDYKIEALGDPDIYTNVGETSGSIDANDYKFPFEPTLTAKAEALNWDGSGFQPAYDPINKVVLNADKRFLITFKNHSETEDTTDTKLGLLMQTGNTDVSWKNPAAEAIEGTNFEEIKTLEFTSGTFSGGNLWNNISTWSGWNDLDSGQMATLRLNAKPELKAGKSVPAGSQIKNTLETYLDYTVNSKNVKHRGGGLEGDTVIYVPGVGTAGLSSAQLGDIHLNEIKESINRNVAYFFNDSSVNSCDPGNESEIVITDLNYFISNNSNCVYQSGDVIYLKGDVTLNLDSDKPLTGKHTLLITGGDLTIQSDLAYSGGDNAFGVIVLDGGNIKIYPDVTSVVGTFYAEGSLISVDAKGKADIVDRGYELRHQLYWKGTIVSENTFGGSDASPLECPLKTCTREEAMQYDLKYLRAFHLNTNNSPSGTTSTGLVDDNALFFQKSTRVPPLFENIGSASDSEIGY